MGELCVDRRSDLEHAAHVADLPVAPGRRRIGVVAVDAGLAAHLIGDGDSHHLPAVALLGAREDRVRIFAQEIPRLFLEAVELTIPAARKRKRAEQLDGGRLVLQCGAQVVDKGGGQGNCLRIVLMVMARLQGAILHHLVDDILGVVGADRLELGGKLLVGENGIVDGDAGHDARHRDPDQHNGDHDGERDREDKSPGETGTAWEPAGTLLRL